MHELVVKDLGIDTYRENIAFLRFDSSVCVSEGFTALTRIEIIHGERMIIATLNTVHTDLLARGEVSLSMEAMQRLGVKERDVVRVRHVRPVESFSRVRAKMYGNALIEYDYADIMVDIVAGRYSNIEMAAFISACSGDRLSNEEVIWLTKAMIACGNTLQWSSEVVHDKHCIGGLPGNRTTPIVVSIVAAAGLLIPKTSSRAITSPAGTADVMETMTTVNLSIQQMRSVVGKTGGCMVWGGGIGLSPADDMLISVERALNIDSRGQMIASVLSKKVAAGATNVVLDIPVGPTAKVRTLAEARHLVDMFTNVGTAVGIAVDAVVTNGEQPVGMGLGPALEALDVLRVLRHAVDRPMDLEQKALDIASRMVDRALAVDLLSNGAAYAKFLEICNAQGGFKEPMPCEHKIDVVSASEGVVSYIDNRRLARIAKLAGAPQTAGAGIEYHAPLGKHISKGDRLFTLYAGSTGGLDYALEYYHNADDLIMLH